MRDFSLQISNFNGPLDLLLDLVKSKQMDLLTIDLVELANSYVSLIETMKHENIDLASEYLVMAATLINLKSKLLIENPSNHEEIEQEREDLLSQLVEYSKFKRITIGLRNQEELRHRIFIKSPVNYENFQSEENQTVLVGNMSASALVIALKKMFERVYAEPLREALIEQKNISPSARRFEILTMLSTKNQLEFVDIFTVPSISHFAITVLTILDMARNGEVIIHQAAQFGAIIIQKGEMQHDT